MTQIHKTTDDEIIYPESDGKPLAENTLQFDYIVMIKEGIEDLFSQNPDVFVAGDLLWYPVKGQPKINAAPDTMVVFGRPKGFRKSYLQWEENKLAPQVVFEIWSEGNRKQEREDKLKFYETYKVQEYYAFDPLTGKLDGWQRQENKLVAIEKMQGWVSPLLNIRFELQDLELKLYRPDGQAFVSYSLMAERARIAERQAESERIARERAEEYAMEAARRVEQERNARQEAERKVEQEQSAREQAERRVQEVEQKAKNDQAVLMEQIRAKLRAQGIDPDSIL